MSRYIFHVDMNNFYASVESVYDPSLNKVPMVVGGDEELRHGIVLSKNEIAKKLYGVKTGEVLWQVRQRCPELVVIHPDMQKYFKFSRAAMEIYEEYSDRVESFGLDEAWIDVSHFDPAHIRDTADGLRARIREELGVTISVGVSFNKVFAKLGSDMKKPDATTVLDRSDYRALVWPQSVASLLYVGRASYGKLRRLGIETIGDLARFDKGMLHEAMGKWGDMLWSYANGLDSSPVALKGTQDEIKSIGNSTTPPRDLVCDEDVRIMLFSLSESVARRLREKGLLGSTVAISVRDNKLSSFERQHRLDRPTQLSGEIAQCAFSLFRHNYDWSCPIRSIGVRVAQLEREKNVQLDFFGVEQKREKTALLEKAADNIRTRFGKSSLYRASMLLSPEITSIASKSECFLSFKGCAQAYAAN